MQMIQMSRRLKDYLLKASALIFILLFNQLTGFSQDSVALNLDDAIKTAVANNANVQMAKTDEAIAASQYKETNAIFLPQLGVSYTAITTNNPLNAFGFKLQQQSIKQSDFNPDLLNNPSGTPDFMTKVDLKQPIINMDMLYQRKSAEKQIEVYEYKTQRTKEYITFQVRQAYLQLQLAYDAKKVLEEALQTAQAMYKFTSDHYDQGLIQKSDLLNAQVQVTTIESNIADTKSNIENASDFLSQLMGKDKSIIYNVPASSAFNAISATDSLPAARADFKAMETAINSYDLMIKSNKMSYLPKLNAFATYQLNDNSAFGFGSNAYLVGAQLSWDIFKGTSTKNKINTQTLERNKLQEQLDDQKEENKVELNKAYRQLSDAQFKINQQKAAVEQASEALRILQDRYQQGLVNTTDVLMAQTQLSQQKLAYAQAVFSSNMAIAYIQFLTATNN